MKKSKGRYNTFRPSEISVPGANGMARPPQGYPEPPAPQQYIAFHGQASAQQLRQERKKAQKSASKPKSSKGWWMILACSLVILCLLVAVVWRYVFSEAETGLDIQAHSPLVLSGGEQEEKENPVVPYDKELTNILLIGVDARDENSLYTNADTIILLTLDQKKHEVRLASFQRDMILKIAGQENYQKLNSAMFGGPSRLMDTLNQNFKLDIHQFIVINFLGAERIVDLLGGVDLDVPDDPAVLEYLNSVIWDTNKELGGEHWAQPIQKGGYQHLDGRQAISFARLRKLDSDFNRMERQQMLLQILFTKFKAANPIQKLQLMKESLSLMSTNLTETEMLGLVTSALPQVNASIAHKTVPLPGYFEEATIQGIAYTVPYLQQMVHDLHLFIYGQVHDDGRVIDEYSKIYEQQKQYYNQQYAQQNRWGHSLEEIQRAQQGEGPGEDLLQPDSSRELLPTEKHPTPGLGPDEDSGTWLPEQGEVHPTQPEPTLWPTPEKPVNPLNPFGQTGS